MKAYKTIEQLEQEIIRLKNKNDLLLKIVLIAKKYDCEMCFCDDQEINQGGGMCTQCDLRLAFQEYERGAI